MRVTLVNAMSLVVAISALSANAGAQQAACDILTGSAILDPESAADHQDEFGASVAIDNNYNVIGAPGRDNPSVGERIGAVFVHDGITFLPTFFASDAEAEDEFGRSVAIDGLVVAVGAPGDSNGAGSAYVFDGNNAWQETKLVPLSGTGAVGFSIAISGDVVVVGGNTVDGTGAAFVFEKPQGGWPGGIVNESAKLTSSGAAPSDQFGNSVAIDGDIIVVGAVSAGLFERGAAYVFEKPLTGWANMTETAKLEASNAEDQDFFGRSVAVSGSLVAVGARETDNDPNGSQGSAYVFEEPIGGWSSATEPVTEIEEVFGCLASGAEQFGASAAIDGDLILVGADRDSAGGDMGVASAFKRCSGDEWLLVKTMVPADEGQNNFALFSASVSVSGDKAAVGAPNFSIPALQQQGAFYQFQSFSLDGTLCPEDIDGDGDVDVEDFLALLANWGNVGSGDNDCDGTVGTPDFLNLLAAWGLCAGLTGEEPMTLEEELQDACLTQDDWDKYEAVMTDPESSTADKIRYDCWMRHYLFNCDNCSCGPEICSGRDPFAD